MEIKQAYKKYLANGIKTLPTEETKEPLIDPSTGFSLRWKQPFSDTLFNDAKGIGLMCGSVSGGLECIDFDNHLGNAEEIFHEYFSIPEIDKMLGENKLFVETTKRGGFHVVYKTEFFQGNQKLARQRDANGKIETVIETRGDGGYFCAYPTDGYKWIGVSPLDIEMPFISNEERSLLLNHARSYNTIVKDENATQSTGEKVGDIYNNDLNAIDEAKTLLTNHGWRIDGKLCKRPGKEDKGYSATFGRVAPNVFYVFSTNATPFESEHPYKPFQIKALLEHNGDFKACAKELYERYGITKNEKTETEQQKDISDLEKLLNAAKVDPTKKLEKPPTILSVVEQNATQLDYIPLLTLGDFSVLMGKQKSKKTYFTSMVSAAFLTNGIYENKLSGSPIRNKTKLVFFDTEQGEWYAQKTAKRIYYQTSQSDAVDYFMLRDFDAYKRRDVIEFYLQMHPNIGLVAIDGIVDLLYDFNSQEESAKLIQWVMTITKKYNVHVINIIHQNKADGNARGHLGTMLAQKAETVLEIKKDESDGGNSSIIKCADMRGKDFNEFKITINSEGIPYFEECIEKSKIF